MCDSPICPSALLRALVLLREHRALLSCPSLCPSTHIWPQPHLCWVMGPKVSRGAQPSGPREAVPGTGGAQLAGEGWRPVAAMREGQPSPLRPCGLCDFCKACTTLSEDVHFTVEKCMALVRFLRYLPKTEGKRREVRAGRPLP